jgi:hypothetical protein
MFAFHHKPIESHDDLVWRLLDSPLDERQFVLIAALQTGEVSLKDTPDVLLFVERIESLARPPRQHRPVATGDLDPIWKMPIHRYTL